MDSIDIKRHLVYGGDFTKQSGILDQNRLDQFSDVVAIEEY